MCVASPFDGLRVTPMKERGCVNSVILSLSKETRANMPARRRRSILERA